MLHCRIFKVEGRKLVKGLFGRGYLKEVMGGGGATQWDILGVWFGRRSYPKICREGGDYSNSLEGEKNT